MRSAETRCAFRWLFRRVLIETTVHIIEHALRIQCNGTSKLAAHALGER